MACPIRCVAPPRPIGALLGLTGSQNPFAGTRTYRSIAHLPLAQRVAAMRDPEVRAKITTEDPAEFNTWSLLTRIGFERMFRFTDPLNYTPAREDSVAAIAAREGRTPQEVAYDMLIDDDGKGFIFACIVNYANYDLEPVKEMYARQHVIPGLSDGGAHVAFISDASFPTFLFSYWGRDRGADRMDIPDLVRRQTREPARFAGLADRGVLAPGMKADINVIDFANLALERPKMVVDLPAGGRRLLQKARGYAATVKAGQITYRNGVATGALPGGLVRSQATCLRLTHLSIAMPDVASGYGRWPPDHLEADWRNLEISRSMGFAAAKPIVMSLDTNFPESALHPQIRLPHVVVRPQRRRIALRHHATRLQQISPARQPQRHRGVLLHQQDRHALAMDLPQRARQFAHHQRRQADARFIDQQQLRPRHQPARERQDLLLAAGQTAGRLAAPRAQDRKSRKHRLHVAP